MRYEMHELEQMMKIELDTYTVIGVAVVLIFCLLTKDIISEIARRLCRKMFPDSETEDEKIRLQRDLLTKFTEMVEKQRVPCENHLAMTQQVKERVEEFSALKEDVLTEKIQNKADQECLKEYIEKSDNERHYIVRHIEWTSRAIWQICQRMNINGLPDEPQKRTGDDRF